MAWERSDDCYIGTELRWKYYPERGRGTWHQGRLIDAGRRPSRWSASQGRTAWAGVELGGTRLFEKIWWDPSGRTYSREQWQDVPSLPPLTLRRILEWDVWYRWDQLDAIDLQLSHMLSDVPLPLPGESELYDLFDVLQLRRDILYYLNVFVIELLKNLSLEEGWQEITIEDTVKILDLIAPDRLYDLYRDYPRVFLDRLNPA